QNHGFAVRASSLAGSGAEVTHLSINDNTVEGLLHKGLRLFSVQYHPETYPNPDGSNRFFDAVFNIIS
ncbi:MAG TPA: carbamoyl phosphate synthase small subunit, partial [Firmicutes bacterium]|nr:carbamoyl phosphate synthase small subunit [Bacillota bacterium]